MGGGGGGGAGVHSSSQLWCDGSTDAGPAGAGRSVGFRQRRHAGAPAWLTSAAGTGGAAAAAGALACLASFLACLAATFLLCLAIFLALTVGLATCGGEEGWVSRRGGATSRRVRTGREGGRGSGEGGGVAWDDVALKQAGRTQAQQPAVGTTAPTVGVAPSAPWPSGPPRPVHPAASGNPRGGRKRPGGAGSGALAPDSSWAQGPARRPAQLLPGPPAWARPSASWRGSWAAWLQQLLGAGSKARGCLQDRRGLLKCLAALLSGGQARGGRRERASCCCCRLSQRSTQRAVRRLVPACSNCASSRACWVPRQWQPAPHALILSSCHALCLLAGCASAHPPWRPTVQNTAPIQTHASQPAGSSTAHITEAAIISHPTATTERHAGRQVTAPAGATAPWLRQTCPAAGGPAAAGPAAPARPCRAPRTCAVGKGWHKGVTVVGRWASLRRQPKLTATTASRCPCHAPAIPPAAPTRWRSTAPRRS